MLHRLAAVAFTGNTKTPREKNEMNFFLKKPCLDVDEKMKKNYRRKLNAQSR